MAESGCRLTTRQSVRAGGVKDDEEDLGWPVWAGVVPVRSVCDTPESDQGCEAMTVPDALWRPGV